MDLNHKHILLTAKNLATPLRTIEEVSVWLLELVKKVNMKILIGPFVTRCMTEGNEGITGIVCIETSHSSFHCWDTIEKPFFKADLYSCKDFDVKVVIEHCRVFGPTSVEYMVIDRNDNEKVSLDTHMKIVDKGIVDF